jgi:hypothetical protein
MTVKAQYNKEDDEKLLFGTWIERTNIIRAKDFARTTMAKVEQIEEENFYVEEVAQLELK